MKAGVARRIASMIEMGLSPKVKGNLILLAKSNFLQQSHKFDSSEASNCKTEFRIDTFKVQDAAEEALEYMKVRVGGSGGVIVLDPTGNIGIHWNRLYIV